MTQNDLHEITGICRPAISQYINGKSKPDIGYLVAISVALKLSVVQSTKLFELCNRTLKNNTEQEIIYRYFLESCGHCKFMTVEWCNNYLHEMEMPSLIKGK